MIQQYIDSHIQTFHDNGSPFNKAEGAREKWIKAGWWAKFTGVCFGLIIIGYGVFIAFISISYYNTAMAAYIKKSAFQSIIGFVILVSMLSMGCMMWLFGNEVRKAIMLDNMTIFNKGLVYLKKLFITTVISFGLTLAFQMIKLITKLL
jgi:hypothetical protein